MIITRVKPDLASRCANWLEVNAARSPWDLGCRDQTGGEISCTVAASLHPHTHPAHSHVRTPVISAGGCARAVVCDRRAYICLCFPLIVSIIHSSPCRSSPPPLLFVLSIPPTLFWSLSPFLSHSLSVIKTCTCTHPSTHTRSWHGRVPGKQHGLAWGYAKKYKKKKKFGAAPLPNGVSMATKGAWPYNEVSNKTQDFKP